MPSHIEEHFASLNKAMKLGFIREHRFHPTRRWRFDFADEEKKIAVEIEGGIFMAGAHTRGVGYQKDTEKYNQATILGWKVLRYCSKQQIDEQFISDYEALTNAKT